MAAVGHVDLVFLMNMTTPHAFSVDPSVSSPAESAAETRFLPLRPAIGAAILEILLPRGVPTSGRLELGGITDSVWVAVSLIL